MTRNPLEFCPSTDEVDAEECGMWYADRYKVVRYDNVYVPLWNYLGPVFMAYFKPDGWKGWGNGVAREYTYRTFADAVAACERHRIRGDYGAETGKMSS